MPRLAGLAVPVLEQAGWTGTWTSSPYRRTPPAWQLAALPGVYAVQPVAEPVNRSEMSVQINFGNVDAAGYAWPGYRAYLTIWA